MMTNDLMKMKSEMTTQGLSEKAQEYRRESRAANTMKGYESDLKDFSSWCEAQGLQFLPASSSSIAEYITYLASEGYKVSTIKRRITAISQLHEAQGYESPTKTAEVRDVLKGIKRKHGTAQDSKKPIMTDDLRRMIEALPDSLLGLRDRALLLVGYAKACRRSELIGLDVDDLEFTRDGLVLTLKRSKTDQEGEGTKYGIPFGSNPSTCPVRALEDWLTAAGIAEGPVFRSVDRHGNLQDNRLSTKAVAIAVKRACERVGLNPDDYAGHSLRSGLATEAASRGVSERAIMNQTGHKSVQMVRRYIKEGSLFRDNAAGQVGL